MKYFLSLVFFTGFLTAGKAQQKLLTMQDAMLKARTTLAPQTLSQLQFISGTDDYIYLQKNASGETFVRGNFTSRTESPFLTLAEFNARLHDAGRDSVTAFPPVQFNNANYTASIKGVQYSFASGARSVVAQSDSNLVSKLNFDRSKSGFVAYLQDHNLFISKGGDNTQVTTDGSTDIVYASSVHREEFGITKGTFWSNSGDRLAFYRMDQSMVKDYPIIDWTQRPAVAQPIKYPMAGDSSHHVTVGVYNAITKKTVWVQTREGIVQDMNSGFPVLNNPAERYLTNISWTPDDRFILIAVVNRAQNQMWLNKYSAENGAFVATVFEETDPKYVEPLVPALFVPQHPDQFIWQSRRDGWNHLYLYDLSGKLIQQLNKGDWEVIAVNGIDAKGENIFYTSTEVSPLSRNVYALNLRSGKKTLLTPAAGVHNVLFSDDKKYMLDSYSSTSDPKTINVEEVSSGRVKNLLQSTNPLAAYALGEQTIFTITNDEGIDLWCRMYKPVNFDATKKYPVIVYWYGGPHAQLILNSWNAGASDYWFQYMAERGYVVFTLDPRGSENRGRAFEQAIYRHAGSPQMADLEKGIRFLAAQSFTDTAHMGLFGWSYGGFMTTDFFLNHPGVFKAAVAGGPVMNWQYYEVMYGERYMDTPQENPEGYAATNLIAQAGKLRGKLLLIHGLQDPVVVQENSVNFVKACIDANVQVDYMIYPGYEHNVIGKDRAHLYQKITDYFDQNLH